MLRSGAWSSALVAGAVLRLAATATASPHITVNTQLNGYCYAYDPDKTVTITQISNDRLHPSIFEFTAADTATGAATDINAIVLDSNITTGYLRVNVRGARQLKSVQLYRNGVTSTIIGLTLTGDLGENGVLVNSVTGTVAVGGDLRNGGSGCSANVTVGGRLLGNISGGNFNLTVNGGGTHTGSISAGSSGSPFAGTINFTNAGAQLSGYLYFPGGLTGSISLAGNLLYGTFPSGMIHSSADVRGPIHVGGNVAGLIQVNGALRNALLEEEPAVAEHGRRRRLHPGRDRRLVV